jgi:hypothetical protein
LAALSFILSAAKESILQYHFCPSRSVEATVEFENGSGLFWREISRSHSGVHDSADALFNTAPPLVALFVSADRGPASKA